MAAVDSLQKTFETLEQRLNAVARECGELAVSVPVACFVARKAGEQIASDDA